MSQKHALAIAYAIKRKSKGYAPDEFEVEAQAPIEEEILEDLELETPEIEEPRSETLSQIMHNIRSRNIGK